MKFKIFLNEKSDDIKVGDRVIALSYEDGYRGDILETKKLSGIVRITLSKNTYGEYWVGVEFDKKVHNYSDTGKYIPNKKGISYTWWIKNSDLKKQSTSKYVKQLQFEAYEPGQNIEYDRYVVNVKNETQSRKLQSFLFNNGFSWGGSKNYQNSPTKFYGEGGSISFDFNKIDNVGYSGKDFYESRDGRKYNNRDDVYELKEFFDLMEDDERIKIKPSMIK